MPRNLVGETLRRGLYTRLVGKRILYFQELGSTMDEARRQAESECAEGTVVVAETQTASRGRFARTWVSRPGNLYLSVVFCPTMQALPFLSSLGAVAIARTIRRTSVLTPTLKWPNDVLVGDDKVAGVLVESAVQGNDVQYAVLGIGVNVEIDQEDLPDVPPAAGLNELSKHEVSRDELLARLLHELDNLYLELKQGSSPLAEWKGLLQTLGRRVEITSKEKSYNGLAEDIDQLGNLLVRLEDGELVTLTSGDVTLTAPAS